MLLNGAMTHLPCYAMLALTKRVNSSKMSYFFLFFFYLPVSLEGT